MLGRKESGQLMELSGLPTVSAPLPWQMQAWARLGQQIESGQLPHGLLLAGPEFIGKTRFVLALARLLLCLQPRDGLNCGNCHACELTAGGSHGDLRWLQPQEKSRVIKIEQIRKLVEFTNMTASFGLRKVVVLVPANSMNASAANALLKSLEEPADDTYLLLVCHRLYSLPATIRSRCQLLRLPVPAGDQSLDWLDKLSGQRQVSEQLLELADGRPLLAEQIYQQDALGHHAKVRQALRALIAGNAGVAGIDQLLAEDSLDNVLAQIVGELQRQLRQLDRPQLVGPRGHALFGLLDAVAPIQRAANAGANPNRQLLVDAVLSRLQRQLGEAGHSDTIAVPRGS